MPPHPVISFALTKEIPDCPDAGSRCLPYSTRASRVNDLNNLCVHSFGTRVALSTCETATLDVAQEDLCH
jgi:hypothetical protein